jgi:serine/threonine-protein kinase
VPDYPPDLAAAVLGALAKAPEERFASMAELAAALEAVEARLGAPREEVAAFMRAALAERTAKRAGLLQEALRAAAGVGAAGARARSRRDPWDRARGGRTILTGLALVAGGALLGAATLVWLGATSAPAPPAGETAPAGATPADSSPPAAVPARAPVDPAPADPALTPADPPRAPGAPMPLPTTSASSSGALPGAPSSAAPPVEPIGRERPTGRAKFRDPGF